ncbi:hypothetical protein FHX42_000093 [Saccharopolyspora lacisalsi]|uniref:DUF1795 domain-containing protein n=1 Tax=Halosaccharopolyspora lacisalsi TaxID=1000566 RepID=A0A839DMN0_9PSEU|nr:hypothetical protein [Halosaccharopolyspora lacisalsi]MBA8822764.1 hypothetical protein [Halosaccharopolyspora lacisalsi]
MAGTLPIPIRFRVPAGWQDADPDEAGAPNAAFVAVHPGSQQPGSLASITLDGDYRPDPATLSDIADESVGALGQVARAVEVTQRSEFGTSESPGVGQVLSFSVVVGESERELFQCQIYLSMVDTEDPEQRVVVRLVLTANPEQFQILLDDFQAFVASVRADPDGGESDSTVG